MLRDDYERFSQLKGKISGNYEICDERDANYWFPVIKYCNTNTTIWEDDKFDCVFGVYIDVFPIDEYDSKTSLKVRNEFFELCIKYQRTQMKKNFKHFMNCLFRLNITGARFYLENLLYYKWRNAKYNSLYHSKLSEVKQIKGDKYMAYFGPYGCEKEVIEKEWMEGSIEMPYEDTAIAIPTGYNSILTRIYGNYMTPPPIEKQRTHHGRLYVNLDEGLSLSQVKQRLKRLF